MYHSTRKKETIPLIRNWQPISEDDQFLDITLHIWRFSFFFIYLFKSHNIHV